VRRYWLVVVIAFLSASFVIAAAERAGAAETPERAPSSGKVLEVLDVSNYTYVRVDTGQEELWLAGPKVQIKVGDRIIFLPGMLMRNFHSKTLGRTFDRVYFVDRIQLEGAEPARGALPPGHPPIAFSAGSSDPGNMDFSKITKPTGGKTVAEIIQGKDQLSGKRISVRGKVTKFLAGIMNKNWIHLNDGTVKEGAEDLTITTDAKAKIGDTVLVRGVVETEKNFGFGYQYAVIIEDAEVAVE
jgi:hypothetical protein